MSANSKIEWCDHTENFWEGCQKAGPGCDHCYAETRNARFGGGQAVNWGPGAPRRLTSAATWAMPARWNAQAEAFHAQHGRRQRVFALSLGDWLDNQVPIVWLVDMLEVIRTTDKLDWLLLTKRIGTWRARITEARDFALATGNTALHALLSDWLNGKPAANIWVGATIVNQDEADRDIPKLLAVPADKRFLSMEPLLCMVTVFDLDGPVDVPDGMQSPLHWIIVGGESGPGARPMHPDWARSLRDQCEAAGVPFFFKQMGEWAPNFPPCGAPNTALLQWLDGENYAIRVGKKAAGRLLDGRTWDGVPA